MEINLLRCKNSIEAWVLLQDWLLLKLVIDTKTIALRMCTRKCRWMDGPDCKVWFVVCQYWSNIIVFELLFINRHSRLGILLIALREDCCLYDANLASDIIIANVISVLTGKQWSALFILKFSNILLSTHWCLIMYKVTYCVRSQWGNWNISASTNLMKTLEAEMSRSKYRDLSTSMKVDVQVLGLSYSSGKPCVPNSSVKSTISNSLVSQFY